MMFSSPLPRKSVGQRTMMRRRIGLTDIVVGFADQVERDTVGKESAEGLAGCTCQLNVQCIFRQTFGTPAANDFGRNLRTDRTMNVLDRRDKTDFFFLLNGIAAKIQQLVIQFLFQTVILLDALTALVRVVNLRLIENARQVEVSTLSRCIFFWRRRSEQPTKSSNLRIPRLAMISRTSSATKKK